MSRSFTSPAVPIADVSWLYSESAEFASSCTNEGSDVADERVVKVPMRVDLIRRMDQALSEGRGGFTTRAEFVSEAVEQLLVEISYKDAPPEPRRVDRALRSNREALTQGWEARTTAGFRGDRHETLFDGPSEPTTPYGNLHRLEDTALVFPGRGVVVDDGIGRIEDEPLLGLHNRDYPSIWAAHRLALMTQEDTVPWQIFLDRVTAEAWDFASELDALERRGHGHGRRLRAIFPANQLKRQSSERGFQTFGVGTVPRRPKNGVLPVSGPLFVWRIAQLEDPVENPNVGLTRQGWDLLEGLTGISLVSPHDRGLALAFFDHLSRYAPADWHGFEQLLRVVSQRPDRDTVVRSFTTLTPAASPATLSSLAQGYIGRGREWGLIEPRQVEGRYWLTDFGHEQAGELVA
jgi:hypothetical protein